MSTIIVAATLIGLVAAVIFILTRIHQKEKREAMNTLLKHFSQLGTQFRLNMSGQEILKDGVLGLDGVSRKVLVVTKRENGFESFVIDLNEVKSCSVKKVFAGIGAGELQTHKSEQYLEKIVLHFDRHNKPSEEILFYHNHCNHIYEARELEQKARHWEALLSKMQKPVPLIA